MQKTIFKFVIVLSASLILNSICKAQRVHGYIVTENSDTIPGKVRFYIYNINTDSYLINGINLEWYHSQVKFKGEAERKYINYKPDTIIGYGFTYFTTEYIFHKFKLHHNSLFKSNEYYYRFLNLIYKSEVALYRDVIRVPSPRKHSNEYNYTGDQSQTYYEYYLYNNKKGLKKVEITKDIKTVSDLLRYYDFDDAFLNKLPAKTKFKDIKYVLEQYDHWLYECSIKNLNI